MTYESRSRFTQLWGLPVHRNGHVVAIRFGVKNNERAPEAYRLIIRSADGSVLTGTQPFWLRDGETLDRGLPAAAEPRAALPARPAVPCGIEPTLPIAT